MRELVRHGGTCFGLTSDLSTDEGAASLAAEVSSRHSCVDVLVNNAGATWGAPLDAHDEAAWRRVLGLNVEGLFHTTKHFIPLLLAAAHGNEPSSIINIGSIDGIRTPTLETYSYSASKAAVHHLTRHLARRLAPHITVNCVAPGPFASRMMAATLRDHGAAIEAANPMGRIGRPDDLEGVTTFLASRAGAYLTGVVIPVDGGLSATAG